VTLVSANVLQRTFNIAYGDSAGTAFTVDHAGRRYLVTADHVVSGIQDADTVQVLHDGVWRELAVRLVGRTEEPGDIAVLSLEVRLSADHLLPATSAGLFVGQDVFLVGFPFGLSTEAGAVNANFPVPFVKRGILSVFARQGDYQIHYLDGHNNPGFSGGPVVFRPQWSNEFRVSSVISGYRLDSEPVYRGDLSTDLLVRYNTGIVISFNILHAVELIERNPIGFDLGNVAARA
jgi:hypothetical protein